MVDLSLGTSGIVVFRNGEKWWCPLISHEEGQYMVRYEHAWYTPYKKDGTRISAGQIIHADGSKEIVYGNQDRDIIEFIPCKGTDPRVKDLPMSILP